jgi:hypothetical protein
MSRPNAAYHWQEKNREFERAFSGGSAVIGMSGEQRKEKLQTTASEKLQQHPILVSLSPADQH